jgi:putative oxidoreductase
MSLTANTQAPSRRRLLPFRPVPYGTDLAGLAIRAVFGPTLAYHGWQKLDRGAGQFADFVGTIEVFGMSMPEATGYVVLWAELAGGLLITLGLLTRLVALMWAVQFLMIPFVVKSEVGLIGTDRTGFEIDLFIAVAGLVLLFLGPGRPSLDHLLGLEAGGGERTTRSRRTAAEAESEDQPLTAT